MDKAYNGFLKSRLFWEGTAFGMTQFTLPILSIDFSELPAVAADRRLGHQAEFVFLNLLNSCKEFVVLNHSIQLIEGKKTLGELDFIVRNVDTEEILHVELTYKFYIIDKTIVNPIDQIVGPNRKDTFVYKLKKTRDKQLPLLYSKPSKSILNDIGLDVDDIKQMVAFYAHIFVPYDDKTFAIDTLNEDCIDGYWVTQDQFKIDDFKTDYYYRPLKSEWLHIPHKGRLWKNHEEIMDEISESLDEGRSVMLWKKNRSGCTDGIIERFFIC